MVEVDVQSGQQTFPSLKNNFAQENLLDFLQTTVSTIRSQTTYASTSMTLLKQYTNIDFLEIEGDTILFWQNNRQM